MPTDLVVGHTWINMSHNTTGVIAVITSIFFTLSAQCHAVLFNPLNPHNALMHRFTSLKTDLSFLQSRVLERKFP